METEGKSNVILIKDFFMADEKVGAIMPEMKALTEQDKIELGEGIRNGTLTY